MLTRKQIGILIKYKGKKQLKNVNIRNHKDYQLIRNKNAFDKRKYCYKIEFMTAEKKEFSTKFNNILPK